MVWRGTVHRWWGRCGGGSVRWLVTLCLHSGHRGKCLCSSDFLLLFLFRLYWMILSIPSRSWSSPSAVSELLLSTQGTSPILYFGVLKLPFILFCIFYLRLRFLLFSFVMCKLFFFSLRTIIKVVLKSLSGNSNFWVISELSLFFLCCVVQDCILEMITIWWRLIYVCFA